MFHKKCQSVVCSINPVELVYLHNLVPIHKQENDYREEVPV